MSIIKALVSTVLPTVARRSKAWPLLPQMLWPIIFIEVTLLAIVVAWYTRESYSHIQEDTSNRAELIAQAVEHRGQSTAIVEALNRVAESFAANRDVEEISIIDRTTRTIRNSSNPQIIGQLVSQHPDELVRTQLESMIKPNTSHGVYGSETYVYVMPTILPPTKHNQRATNGIIMVKLNVMLPWQTLWRDIIAFALTGGLLICATVLFFYGMIYAHIYRPLTIIRATMLKYTAGHRDVAAPPMYSSEFDAVATSMNSMLRKQTENEEQLNSYTNQMELLTMEMEKARDDALHANKMKSEFLATMSHEIRTPMNGVIGMTDLLLDSGLNSKQNHYARTVQQSAEALLSLIDDILDFSKIEAGKIELEKSPFNLTELTENLGDILSVRARDKALELVMHIDPRLPQVFIGDSSRLRQVLVNLLGNAIKFTHHGYVMLSVQINEEGTHTEFTEGQICPLTIRIKDTGVGIPFEMQQRVFEKFVQADSSTTRKFGGTGLGLAICQQLIHLMNGSISVESTLNEGTTFTINLDLPIGKIRRQINNYPELAGKRILVIDDLPINLTVIQKQLEHLDMETSVALNGKQAHELAESANHRGQPFDVFLIDYLMPVQNGEQLGSMLHNIPAYTDTPLVMMSASDGLGYQKRFTDKGFCGLLGKPFSLNTLAETLASALRNETLLPVTDAARNISKGAYRGKRVLVADDNRSNREYISTLMEEMGFVVDEAVNGAVALKNVTENALNGTHFDLILMDCEMPELDGRTATRNLREKYTADDLPILALTGHTDAQELDICRKSGMNDCLAKPLRRADLEAALRRWLPLPAALPVKPLEGRNILLVEDNRFNREFMTELLSAAGATVHTADNGLESLKMFARHPYLDAILMDCQMPEMDGYQATEKIRQRQAAGEWPYIPIIALTANAMKGDREKCLAVGMDDYLAKPVNKQQLFATLQEWLNRDTSITPRLLENATGTPSPITT